jgi:hypothetical protein
LPGPAPFGRGGAVASRPAGNAAVEVLAGQHAAVEVDHQFAGLLVGHLPQAHHQGPRPRHNERPAQAEDPLADVDLAQPRLAGRQDHQFGVQQVQAGHILGGEQAVLGIGRQGLAFEPCLGAGQRQPRAQQGLSGRVPDRRPALPEPPSIISWARDSLLGARSWSVRKKPCVARCSTRGEARPGASSPGTTSTPATPVGPPVTPGAVPRGEAATQVPFREAVPRVCDRWLLFVSEKDYRDECDRYDDHPATVVR